MSNYQFEVYYNGNPVEVTSVGNNTYLVQITYKPMQLQLQKSDSGDERWIDLSTNLETSVTKQLGGLIQEHLAVEERV
jgi:hypothetical protein